MNNLKFRQFIDGEFWYWGYGADAKREFVPPKDPSVPSEQWTGESDINGIKIYSGDILRWDNLLEVPNGYEDFGEVQVIWEFGSWRLRYLNGHELGRWGLWKNIDDQNTEDDIAFKVIGNTSETPGLIK